MKNILLTSFVLGAASCGLKNIFQKNEEPRIRIVDLEGKSRSVVTRTPILNNKALMLQRQQQGQYQRAENVVSEEVVYQNDSQYANPSERPIGELNYGAASSEIIQQTLQPTQATPQGQNPIVAANDPARNLEVQNSIEYDLGDDVQTAPVIEEEVVVEKPKKVESKKKKFVISSQKQKGLFVQVGSFRQASNAKKSLEEMQTFHQGRIEKVQGKRVIYRVLLGPFTSKKQANALVKRINDAGHDAVLMRNR